MILNIKDTRLSGEKSVLMAHKVIETALTGNKDSELLLYPICNIIALELISRDENIRTSSNFINTTITKIAYDLKELAVFNTPATKIVKILSDLITFNKLYMKAEIGFIYGIGNKLPLEVTEYWSKNEAYVNKILSNFRVILEYAILEHRKEGLSEE